MTDTTTDVVIFAWHTASTTIQGGCGFLSTTTISISFFSILFLDYLLVSFYQHSLGPPSACTLPTAYIAYACTFIFKYPNNTYQPSIIILGTSNSKRRVCPIPKYRRLMNTAGCKAADRATWKKKEMALRED